MKGKVMGYYTDYALNVRKIKSRVEFEHLCDVLKEEEIIGYVLDDGTYIDSENYAYFNPIDSVKWYDHSDSMCQVSEQFPEMVFMLEGIGEESDDRWREYYQNGKYETCRARVIFEDPTEIKWD